MITVNPRPYRLPADERGITLADFLVPIRVGERMGTRLRHIALIVVGALFIALTAQIEIIQKGQSIPLIADYQIRLASTPVPITGQTFGVLLVGGALGFRRGIAASTLYILLGVIGLPFFAEGKSGVETVFGASGGYLIGFVLAAALVGRLAELGWDRKLIGSIAAMVLGNALIYVVGLPWLKVVTGETWAWTLQNGLYLYVAGDVLKLLLAAAAFPAAWWLVGRRPGDR
jgi:biotin transport system substrate-specific component